MGDRLDDIRAYKPFIDGLRAVAILSVVASHAGVPGLSGGYVGVDIFFVLSGYLIIGQIEADVAAGRFSFIDFAARRALRILPAFLVVMIACLVLVSTVFLQTDYDGFSDSFLQTSIMFANHYFLSQQDYFTQWAFTKPLLHMWSLSVEEQFYLVAPFAVAALYAVTRGLPVTIAPAVRHGVALGLAIASFAACVMLTYGVSHNAAFYAMPTRGWEFILGGFVPVAVAALRRRSGAVAETLALLGVAAIAFAIVTFDSATYYPTFRAAFPVLGTSVIIACGIAAPGNHVARALATPIMTAIGRVSYSWYLWHWPLLSFLRTSEFSEDDVAGALAVAAVALVLAILTYVFVEQPIRAWRLRRKPRAMPVIAAMAAACLLVGAGGFAWTRYELPRLMPELAGLKPAVAVAARAPSGAASASPQSRAGRGWLLGDSEAWNLRSALETRAAGAGADLSTSFKFGCPPIIGVDMVDRFGDRVVVCNEMFSNLDLSGGEFAVL
ncbi:MAG: acyltransferase, partial [Alphaproteobacteria bacterium]|nr:acyltransferase [Alphaproteobacteria bacterium]